MLIKSIGLVRKKQYRILHAVEESVFIALLLCICFRIPYIYDMDSLLSRQLADMFPWIGRYSGLLQWFEKWAMGKSKGILVVCKDLKKIVQNIVPATPVAVLEDISLFDEQGGNTIVDDIRQTRQINGQILMYVGNLEKYQGIDLLLRAFALLPQEQQESELVLIGGRDKDIDKYRQKSLSLGIAERVHFLGPKPVEHLGQYLQQANILVSPRVQGNNTPMKIYSYLASGKAIVATRLPTHTQVLDEDIALLCEPEATAFMHALHTLVNNKELQVQLGQAAAGRARQRYSRQAYRTKLHYFYLDVLGPPA